MALVRVMEDHAGAINYDLIRLGLRLRMVGTEALTWGDLHDVVKYGRQDTALALEREGPPVLWTITDHLIATAVDALHAGNWQRGGGKGHRPKPIPRPGVDQDGKVLGADPIPAQDFDAWWNEN